MAIVTWIFMPFFLWRHKLIYSGKKRSQNTFKVKHPQPGRILKLCHYNSFMDKWQFANDTLLTAMWNQWLFMDLSYVLSFQKRYSVGACCVPRNGLFLLQQLVDLIVWISLQVDAWLGCSFSIELSEARFKLQVSGVVVIVAEAEVQCMWQSITSRTLIEFLIFFLCGTEEWRRMMRLGAPLFTQQLAFTFCCQIRFSDVWHLPGEWDTQLPNTYFLCM